MLDAKPYLAATGTPPPAVPQVPAGRVGPVHRIHHEADLARMTPEQITGRTSGAISPT